MHTCTIWVVYNAPEVIIYSYINLLFEEWLMAREIRSSYFDCSCSVSMYESEISQFLWLNGEPAIRRIPLMIFIEYKILRIRLERSTIFWGQGLIWYWKCDIFIKYFVQCSLNRFKWMINWMFGYFTKVQKELLLI